MLQNEKYCSDVVLYKTCTDEFLSSKRMVNIGQKDKIHVENHYPGIITKEMFEETQECMRSRKNRQNDVG